MSKKVFLSYSWDSKEHKEWVAMLANALRVEYGIEAVIDNFLLVNNLNKMMVQEISDNDKVIIVVTSKYTEKANAFSGGVGYETELLLNYIQNNPNKLIVIMREQCEKPTYIQNFYHIDFVKDDKFSESIEELVLRITDTPKYIMEDINTDNPKQVSSKKIRAVTNEEDLVAQIEKLLAVTGYSFNAKGKMDCATWIKDFGYELVVDSVKTALSQYLEKDDSGNYSEDSVNRVFQKIGGICYNKYEEKTKPYVSGTKKIINYCKKKFRMIWYDEQELNSIVGMLLYHFYTIGVYDEKLEMLMQYARTSRDIEDYMNRIAELKKQLKLI